MKLLIIRHGDPDYEHDSLTDRGRLEAAALADYYKDYKIDKFYVSPLGRAQLTAKYMMDAKGVTGTTCDWMREFAPAVKRPDLVVRERSCCWDWLPQDWTEIDEFYDADKWYKHPIMAEAGIEKEYKWVCDGLDELLANHGYVRDGRKYKVTKGNDDTIALVCHFGLESVLLSHLMSVSPMILWHGMCAAPTSVTTVYTEERREGIASFRVRRFGEVAHLNAADIEPSKHAAFREWMGEDGRID